jgi:DNA-binding response OmpR family regulator
MGPLRVLVVEDDADTRAMVRDMLADEGYSVIEAADGELALNQLLEDPTALPSLVVLDLDLPRLRGQDLIAVITNYHRLAQIPIVVVSGVDWPFAERFPSVRAYLKKPLDSKVFLKTVSALLHLEAV